MNWVLLGGSSLRRVGTQRRLGVLVLLNQALHFPSKEVSCHPFSSCNRNYKYFRNELAVNRGRFYFFYMVKSLSITNGWFDSLSFNVHVRKMG